MLVANPPWLRSRFEACMHGKLPNKRKDECLEYPIYLAYVAAVSEESVIDVEFIDQVSEDLSIARN